jgi:hypothetical protein
MKKPGNNTFLNSVMKFIGMTLGLALCGAILAIIGALIGGGLITDEIFAAWGLAILGVIVGYLLGNFIGILLIKKFIHSGGSLPLGILGILVGIVVAVIIGIAFDPGLYYIGFASVPVLCLAGFYLKK